MDVVKGRREWVLGAAVGAGGFGRVFAARSGDQEAVAKLVPKDPGAERELLFADDLSGVRNVVPVLDQGETTDNWAIVMPRAERSLSDHLREAGRPLNLDESLPILVDIAEALVDLGEKDIVHRDLKPSNVLLLNGHWCLADFGISRYAAATTAENTRKFSMTMEYAAPEQWRFERATSRTDVYALGVLAYEMLAGRLPFTGPDFRHQHLHENPHRLAAIPTPVASLLEQCLLKAAGSRPSPRDVLERLQRQSSVAPVGGGLAALQEANRAMVSRLGEEALQASETQTEAERRAILFGDAERQMRSISTTLYEAIQSVAPLVTAVGLRPSERRDSARDLGWSLSLNVGTLELTLRRKVGASGLPFDVIANCEVGVRQSRVQTDYGGRLHSLWFCDAQEAGQYRWYETAFMDMPLMRAASRPVDPFAVAPDSAEAWQALNPGMGTHQCAWPFSAVDPGDMGEFISRWAGWFAEASAGRLMRPMMMPERQPSGSWRTR